MLPNVTSEEYFGRRCFLLKSRSRTMILVEGFCNNNKSENAAKVISNFCASTSYTGMELLGIALFSLLDLQTSIFSHSGKIFSSVCMYMVNILSATIKSVALSSIRSFMLERGVL